jgi:hypothetical protein
VRRKKQVPFTDSLAVWAETCDEQEFRDGAVMLGIYARQRKFAFAVRIEPVKLIGHPIAEAGPINPPLVIREVQEIMTNCKVENNTGPEKALPLLDQEKK